MEVAHLNEKNTQMLFSKGSSVNNGLLLSFFKRWRIVVGICEK